MLIIDMLLVRIGPYTKVLPFFYINSTKLNTNVFFFFFCNNMWQLIILNMKLQNQL